VAAAAAWLAEGLIKLETLRLARCRLTTFPCLSACHRTTLSVIDLSGNRLTEVRCMQSYMAWTPSAMTCQEQIPVCMRVQAHAPSPSLSAVATASLQLQNAVIYT
jgi:hypothetical protein